MEKKLRRVIDNSSVVILLILLLFSVFFVTGFTRQATLTQLILEISMYGMVAVGLCLVMIGGGIDLSVGYMMGTVAVAVIAVGDASGSLAIAVLAGLAAGLAMGALNGFFITRVGINPLIATIALNYIYNGIVLRATNQSSFRAQSDVLSVIYSYRLFGVPVLNITLIGFVILLIALDVLLRTTNTGNSIYVTGGNSEAGALSGIDPKKHLFLCYLICGACCAVSGIFLASRFSGASYTLGAGKDVFAISACVIGGIKMTGGSGTIPKVLIGIIIMRLITTVMNLMMIPTAWTDMISGALLLVILILDRLSKGFEKA